MNMKGFGGIFIIIGILMIAFLGFLFYIGLFKVQKTVIPSPNPTTGPKTYSSLSDDPKYQDVKNKYNLNEQQLQILSTVDPNDNE